MPAWLNRIIDRPVVSHLLSANKRYGERLGSQFAAGVAYYSVLSLIPVLMFTFSILGLTLTVLRPEMLDSLKLTIHDELGTNELAASLTSVIDSSLSNWRSVGIVALITAAYSGSRWAGTLKRSVRVMWAEDFEEAIEKKNFFLELGINLVIFLGLITCVGIGLGVSAVGSGFSEQVIEWLGWQDVPGIGPLVRLVAILGTFVACWILFAFLFIVMPNDPVAPRVWLLGTVLGAVATTVLQSLAGLLLNILSGNVSAAIFGNVILLMLVFNILATIILMSAAWVGTAPVWRTERADRRAERERARLNVPQARPDLELPASTVVAPSPIGPVERFAGLRTAEELRVPLEEAPAPDPDAYIRQDIARHGMKANLLIGYSVGAGTGLGLGALIVAGLKRLVERR